MWLSLSKRPKYTKYPHDKASTQNCSVKRQVIPSAGVVQSRDQSIIHVNTDIESMLDWCCASVADGGQHALKPFKPLRCIKASFYISENRLNFPTTRGFIMTISMKLVYQYMVIFFNFSPPSNHLHPLQVGNCDSNSRLVVDEDDNDKFRLERVTTELLPLSCLLW